MAKNVCIMLISYGETVAPAVDAFRLGAVSAEMGNRTVVYLGPDWPRSIIPRGHPEKGGKSFLGPIQNSVLPHYQRFRAAGGVLWVTAQVAQDYTPDKLIDGVTFVDERTLLEYLAQDTIALQF
ncbi:MAG TPA: hypothetical protein VKT82_32030 [Ktedonobacterales bacterium]|nr:hypothetical protein [Ktedonobacterales bacterium]